MCFMKKYLKLLFLLIFVIVMIIVIFFYRKISFYNVVDNTVKLNNKINYTTNIELITENKNVSMKINYEMTKSNNIKKITIDDYINDEVQNNLLKYVVDSKTYVYDSSGKYEEKEDDNDFNVNYKSLKDKMVSLKSKSSNKYVIKMNKYDAYNLIYDKEILTKDKINGTVDVTILVDEKNNFIKEISYEIEDLNLYDNSILSNYKVKITNTNINTKEEITLPFEINE